MKRTLFAIFTFGLLSSCGLNEKKDQDQEKQVHSFAEPIESAHQKEVLQSMDIIQFDMTLVFRGKIRFEGQVSLSPDGGLVRMEDESKTMIWDGKEAHVSPSDLEYPNARFDLLTWSYFFLAPYKLSDPGTKMKDLGEMKLGEQSFAASKLSFENGVGDTPDDWYICYRDLESDLLVGMAYIVTGSKSVEEAEKDPHCITYEAFDQVNGIPFSTQWNFWTWDQTGALDKLLGSASISKISFKKKESNPFQIDSSFKIAS